MKFRLTYPPKGANIRGATVMMNDKTSAQNAKAAIPGARLEMVDASTGEILEAL